MSSVIGHLSANKAYSIRKKKIESKWSDRGTSGLKQRNKAQSKNMDKYLKDTNLLVTYGKDAMKSRGFAQTTSKTRTSRRVKKKK